MSEYILILVWLGFMAIMANAGAGKRTELVCGEQVQRYSWLFAFVVFVPIIWMAGHRGYVGDTVAYVDGFNKMPDTIAQLPEYIAGIEKDKGFSVLSVVIKSIVKNNKEAYFTVLAAIQGVCIVSVFRKYSSQYIVSVFLFIASTDYISWMYNGVRQFTAVTIAFSATTLMLKKKYILLLLSILLASTMHQSALLMIPFVLIAQGKAWNKKTMIFIVFALVAITFVGNFTNFLDSALADTQYANVVSDYTSWNDDGTSPLRVMVYCVPVLFSYIGRKYIRSIDNPLIDFCTNMSIISAGVYIISMFTSGIFLGRIPIYCSLYGYILLPWEIENLFNEDTRGMIYSALVVCYLIFYYYQMHMAWQII